MGLITSPGAGSGLDVNGIITAILKAESGPVLTRIQHEQAQTNATLSGIGTLSSSLSDLKSSLGSLDTDTDFNLRRSSVSSADYISVTSTNTASLGSHDVEVVALAVGSKRESGVIAGGTSATFGAGQLVFTVGSKSFHIDVTATDTLSTIRNKVNSASGNIGVNASIVTSDAGTKLSFSSSTTGAGNDLTITNDNAALDAISTGTTQTQAAADGQIKIDGALTTSSTNTYTAITDLTIKAIKVNTAGETSTITVANDVNSVRGSIQKFVAAFNDTLKNLKTLQSTVPGAQGTLVGDSSVRNVEARLRALLGKEIGSAADSFNSLSAIGVTTNRDGSLNLDTTILNNALTNDSEGVKQLFTQSGGVSEQFNSLIDSYISSNGVLKSRQESLNQGLTRLDKQKADLDSRLTTMETRLRSQYAALDSIVNQFQSAASFLGGSLGNSSNKK